MKTSTPLQRSVQSRLVQHARHLGVDPNLILARYANERLLYRISVSRHADRFVLKGAMLLVAWLGEMIRPTRDVDLLGFGDLSDAAVAATFADVTTVDVDPDGVTFDPSSISVAPIRVEDAYGGKRVTLTGHLGPARLKVQIDLSEEEQAVIQRRARSSNAPYRQVMRARIVLYLAEGLDNSLIAGRLDVGGSFVSELRKRFFKERLKAMDEHPRSGRRARFSPQRGGVGQSGGV